MLWSLAVLIVCQAAGELLHALFGMPVPGPVLGLALLLLGLCLYARANADAPLLPAADGLLAYLPLFFVPPGVSAVMQIGRFAHAWPAVLVGLGGSSVIALSVTGWLAQGLLARQDEHAVPAPPPDAAVSDVTP